MLTIRRVERGFVNEIFHGISPVRYGLLADICEYIATRQHVSVNRISCEDTYSGIQLQMDEEIDEMRGYTWIINEVRLMSITVPQAIFQKEYANQNEIDGDGSESTFHKVFSNLFQRESSLTDGEYETRERIILSKRFHEEWL